MPKGQQGKSRAELKREAEEKVPDRDLKDESQERLRDAGAPAPPEDNGAADESLERNKRVDAIMAGEEEGDPNRTVKDGGVEGEDLPVVRVGEVYEATRPDDHRRYVKVIAVEDDGRVLVQNEETYVKSHITPERFVPSAGWWRRFAS